MSNNTHTDAEAPDKGREEWQWVKRDPAEYDTLNMSEIWVLVSYGIDQCLVGFPKREFDDPDGDFDDEFDKPMWQTYVVLHPEQDGFSGYEHIDGAETLADAQAQFQADREAIIASARELAAVDT